MSLSKYKGKHVSKWGKITDKIIASHPLKPDEIVKIVLKSWDDIFKSKIGSFYIGKEIFPTPQIMSFLLHELIAHYLALNHSKTYKVGTKKNEKDIHSLKNISHSIEIKASSHANQIFANRSYAQPQLVKGQKNKDGYYITVNFEKFNPKGQKPKILLIRFGYIEHSDWTAQSSATGQQARLSAATYQHKLRVIYPKLKKV